MTATTYDLEPDISGLRGSQKAAALLLLMGKSLASRLLVHFSAEELKSITRSAADLGSVPVAQLEALVEEFAGAFSSELELSGNPNLAQGLLTGAFPPEQIADIMSDVLGSPNQSTWQKISAVPVQTLFQYLMAQHPQVIALALSRLEQGTAANLMSLMPLATRNEAMRRLLSLQAVKHTCIRLVETKLHEELVLNPPPPADAAAKKIAGIVNKMTPQEMQSVLEALRAERPKDAQMLSSKLFSFDDLVKLPQDARRILFEKVPSERIVVALNGVETEFRDNVLSSLTARARRLVENELNTASDVNQKNVTAARRAITDLLLGMAERGEIELTEQADETSEPAR